jgi:RimJ/RimL family protein N-acetyltransferase
MTLCNPTPGTCHGASTPVLETERLVLRTPRLEDAKRIAALANDRRIAENTARLPHPYSLADAKDFIRSVTDVTSSESFVVTIGGEVIGACGYELRNSVPQIGYWLGVPFWGNGYATETARALIDHALGERFHTAVEARARTSNPASRRVLEKCGFQWTGVGLYRIGAIRSAAPFDRFRLERAIWVSLKSWGATRRHGRVGR